MPKKAAVKQSAKKSAKKPAKGSAKSAAKKPSLKLASKAQAKVAKKATKKVAKKAAKKAPAKHAEGHHLRRAYEHLHRVGVIHQQLDRQALAQIDTLSELAQAALMAEDARSAADLLRAAEHLAFGSLALDSEDVHAGDDLLEAAQREFDTLSGSADERWAEQGDDFFPELAPVFEEMRRAAEIAFNARALHRALEYARGAEALTHAEPAAKTLPPAKSSSKRVRD